VAVMALAVLLFTCIDTSAKWLVTAGFAAIQVVFVRYAMHFVLASALFLPREGAIALRSNAPVRQAMRSVFLFGSTMCNFAALQYLPLTLTTTILFAGPVAITLLAIPILGERVGIHRILAVCTGFIGVLVVMQPWGARFHPAMFLSLTAMLSASMYFIMTRALAGVERNSTSQLWASGLATICLAPFAIGAWVTPDTTTEIVVTLLIGTFGAVSHILATYAHRLADASILSPLQFIQMGTAAIASIIFFGVYPTIWTLIGGGIIVLAGLYIWHRERKRGAG